MAGQTLAQIRALLADAGISPLRRFGQNFLIDLNLMRKMVAAAQLKRDDVVLEVGCGTGSLTELLLETGASVVGVEIDRGLQKLLQARFGGQERFSLVAEDVLESKHHIRDEVLQRLAEASQGATAARKLVSNLPYQVATPLLMDLLLLQPSLASLTCTIQREVGERLLAQAASSAYGPISIIAQTLATVEVVARVPASAFWPRPKVESIMLRIVPGPVTDLHVADIAAFVELVQRGFSSRRKVLRNLLPELAQEGMVSVLRELQISPTDRPEAITPAGWRKLHAELAQRHRECAWRHTDG